MVSGLWTLYCGTARWRVPGSCGGRERATSTVLGLSGGGLKVCSLAPRKGELGAGSSFTVSRQAVPVAERRTCWSLPAMRGSVERSFQSLPGVSCRRRVGPEKESKPQKPVTVPETVVASAGGPLLAGFSGVAREGEGGGAAFFFSSVATAAAADVGV